MKDYSKIFDHYYGLQYDGNVNDMIKIHELMEEAGIQVSASTKDKLSAYSDKRPFKVNYFISRLGKTLKWCPTNSPDKFAKMSLKPAEWWIAQFNVMKPVVEVKLPDNWLDEQTRHITNIIIEAATIVSDQSKVDVTNISESSTVYVDEELNLVAKEEEDYLPF
jgi:hypothetical protein